MPMNPIGAVKCWSESCGVPVDHVHGIACNFDCHICHGISEELPQAAYGTDADDGVRQPEDIFWWGGVKKTVRELNDMRQQGYMSYADYRKALRLPEKEVYPVRVSEDAHIRREVNIEDLFKVSIPKGGNSKEVYINYTDDKFELTPHEVKAISSFAVLVGHNFEMNYKTMREIVMTYYAATDRRLEELVDSIKITSDPIEKDWTTYPSTSKEFKTGYADLMQRIRNGKITTNQARREMGFDEVPQNKRADILQTAEKLINGDRADTYGPPEQSFGRIADLLNAMGWCKKSNETGELWGKPLDAVDVALGLLQLKVSRIISSPDHEDSWVDAAGYAALGGEMATRRNSKLATSFTKNVKSGG